MIPPPKNAFLSAKFYAKMMPNLLLKTRLLTIAEFIYFASKGLGWLASLFV